MLTHIVHANNVLMPPPPGVLVKRSPVTLLGLLRYVTWVRYEQGGVGDVELFLINRLVLGNSPDAIDKQGGRSLCLLIPEGRALQRSAFPSIVPLC